MGEARVQWTDEDGKVRDGITVSYVVTSKDTVKAVVMSNGEFVDVYLEDMTFISWA